MDWGALGGHTFGIRRGPSSEALKMGADYAEHPRIGRKPTQQLAGHKLQDYELKIAFHAQDTPDIQAALLALGASMEQGEILDLVFGEQPDTGIWAGQWVMTDLDVESVERLPGGAIHCAEATIKLKEWADREGLEASERKPPPAVKPAAAPAQKPKLESGY